MGRALLGAGAGLLILVALVVMAAQVQDLMDPCRAFGDSMHDATQPASSTDCEKRTWVAASKSRYLFDAFLHAGWLLGMAGLAFASVVTLRPLFAALNSPFLVLGSFAIGTPFMLIVMPLAYLLFFSGILTLPARHAPPRTVAP